MLFLKYLNHIERIDQLIKLQATGSPKLLAKTLEISESHLYKLLNLMKILGAPIKYNKYKRTYYYNNKVTFSPIFLTNTD